MEIDKIKWHKLQSRGRNHAVLIIDAVFEANRKNYPQKLHSMEYKAKHYRQLDGSRWMGEEDYKNLYNEFVEKAKDSNFLYQWGKVCVKTGEEIIRSTDKYKKTNWQNEPDKKLLEIIEKFFDFESRLWGGSFFYGWYFYFNDVYFFKLEEELKNKLKDKFNEVWQYVLTPSGNTMMGEEKQALLKIAKRFKKFFKEDINNHFEKYAFVNKYYFWGEGYTVEEINKRLKEIISKGERYIDQEIKKFEKKDININNYNLSAETKNIIKGIKEMAHALSLADDSTNYFCYYLTPLYKEAARRFGLSADELVSMTFDEIKKSFKIKKSSVSEDILKERLKDHALIYIEDKTQILIKNNLEEYKKRELKNIDTDNIKSLKGTVAFAQKEKIKAKVKIINSDQIVNKFKKGEILVAPMTNPTYLPAMQKAAAIITDDGGILCHASIVSREIHIPCIVGTKIATQVFKDGDLVEVDTEKGIINIIKRK